METQTSNISVKDLLSEIQKQANKNASNQKNRLKVLKEIPINKGFRQGDVYAIRVALDHPVGKPVDKRQIVDGTTIGSRHVLIGDDIEVFEGVKCPPACKDEEKYQVGVSYAFLVKSPCTLTHPEHGHFRIEEPGLYQSVVQLDMRTLQRVVD